MKFLSVISLCFFLCLCVHRDLSGGSNSRGSDTIDEWGRLHPDAKRWPSSNGWKGFKNVADKVHEMGLKFGIHLMAGISTQAYDSNTPILDTKTGKAYEESGKTWHAKDIGIPERACKWMDNGFMALNVTSGAGKAFLRSLYELYISWGLDFVKLDCVFGEDLDFEEISYVSQTLKEIKPSIVFSLSPGVKATPNMAKVINGLVNTYRIAGDDWDKWSDVASHFDVARDFGAAKLIGAQGLNGKSWPDLDMLPFGWLTDPADNEGPHRLTNLNLEEQQSQMTLWCMAKSPIMYGGDLRNLDSWTKDGFASTDGARAWVATGNNGGQSPQGQDIYIAFFNLSDGGATISVKVDNLAKVLPGKKLRGLQGREVWSLKSVTLGDVLSAHVAPHGCALFVFDY
ncbi:hypothetical protein TanjilG_18947 [Lupinus angustifolius]|uniref:Alpha-galactosidase n=1 Tax=Lupinus angustifolius TaxID=3871 RepID=A0A4P1RR40_LUPAN|nr:hypothetical protein TanjilG_18947 [Lupinus angustifolius]